MIIAKRMLQVRENGRDTPVPVSIELPRSERGAWWCNFEIGWPEGVYQGHAGGFDAVQALVSAMQHVAILLYSSEYHRNRTLVFDEPGEGYGFPLPAGGRDLAIGLDAKL